MMREAPASGWIVRLVNALGPKGLLTWALLLVALVCMVYGLTDVVRGLDVGYAMLIMTTAATVGWILAAFPVHGWISGVAGVFFGLEMVLLRVGRLEGKVFQIYSSILSLLVQIAQWLWAWIAALVQWVFTRELVAVTRVIDWARLPRIYTDLWGDLWTLLSRTGNWLYALTKGGGRVRPGSNGVDVGICDLAVRLVGRLERQPPPRPAVSHAPRRHTDFLYPGLRLGFPFRPFADDGLHVVVDGGGPAPGARTALEPRRH